jgi:hypothetical protein
VEEMTDASTTISHQCKPLGGFDSTIQLKSSSNYFFDILHLREKRNLLENGRMRIIVREAAALVSRLERCFSQLVMTSLAEQKSFGTSSIYDVIQSMRTDIEENKWIFYLRPEHIISVSDVRFNVLYV